jgi:hypothetical protein
MDVTPKPCCYRSAATPDVVFCPECGQAILRCLAFAECGGLVSSRDPCPRCFAPELMIDAGAVVHSRKGDRIAVPLVLINASPAGRPLWVKRLIKRESGAEHAVSLTWERLDAGRERHFTLDTPPLADGGTHTLGVLLVIGSRYKGLEEEYAFATDIFVTVSGQDERQINQTINFAGPVGDNALVNTALRSELAAEQGRGGLQNRQPVRLWREDKYEFDNDIRGYRKERVRVYRDVELTFTGFPQADCPPNARMRPATRVACGRNSRTPDPATSAPGNDVSLRVYDRKGGIDEPATLAISRHHFDLVVVNDRLCLQVRTSHGMELNREVIASGAVSPLTPKDRIVPIPGRPDKLTLNVSYSSSRDTVEQIQVRRTPAVH